ncbi:9327_t:CDS:2 [Gigaspora rosea]|nr:9327_t:CDS:2 [Gigaspora rosea]
MTMDEIKLTSDELVEMRTYEQAYWRTSLAQFAFSIFIIRLFEPAFFGIGMVFLALGIAFLVIAYHRRLHNLEGVLDHSKPFVTSGGYVAISGFIALMGYISLLLLISILR